LKVRRQLQPTEEEENPMNRSMGMRRKSLDAPAASASTRRLLLSTLLAGLAAAAVLLLLGCGKKGPPVPPKTFPPIAVQNLQGSIDGGRVYLVWTLGPVQREQLRKTEGFAVYRSKTSLGEEGCIMCPLIFERVGMVPLAFDSRSGEGKNQFRYNEAVQSGFRYIYKVAAVSNEVGPYSPVVEFITTE
jgi:hypothetical protein